MTRAPPARLRRPGSSSPSKVTRAPRIAFSTRPPARRARPRRGRLRTSCAGGRAAPARHPGSLLGLAQRFHLGPREELAVARDDAACSEIPSRRRTARLSRALVVIPLELRSYSAGVRRQWSTSVADPATGIGARSTSDRTVVRSSSIVKASREHGVGVGLQLAGVELGRASRQHRIRGSRLAQPRADLAAIVPDVQVEEDEATGRARAGLRVGERPASTTS